MAKLEIKPISARQIKQIHTLRSIVGISDTAYSEIKRTYFNVASCKELNHQQAAELISSIQNIGEGLGRIEPKAKRYDDLGKRAGYASPAQLRMIEAMWSGVSRAGDRAGKEKALRKYVERFGVSDLRFVTSSQASKIIVSLKNFGVKHA